VSVAAAIYRLVARLSRPLRRFWYLIQLRAASRGAIPPTTQFDGPVYIGGEGHVTLGEHCRLGRDVYFETNQGGRIVLGDHVTVNNGTMITSYSEVHIGNDCLIGEYVSIRDANHGTAPGPPMRLQDHTFAPIVLEDNVWVARGCVVLKGVHIGAGAVVAANSVVTKDVPANAIVGGIPAKHLRDRVDSTDAVTTSAAGSLE
jgi:acetyltransferase-like isoleucine patch superfamily enzyme